MKKTYFTGGGCLYLIFGFMKNIILLHGALGCKADLEPLAGSLESDRLNIMSFSFSGHGGTAFEPGFTIAQFTAELENFILGNNLKNAVVFGYSMGGYVALNLARQKPELLAKIITLGTKFNWSEDTVKKETAMLQPELVIEKMPLFAESLQVKHGDNWQELLLKTADMMRDINAEAYLNEDVLKGIQTPVLLGIGDKDKMVPLDETVNVFKTLPNAGMYMLPYTRHLLETADPAFLSRIIKDALAKP